MLTTLSLVVAAYLLGSVATAIIVCRLLNLADPRTEGSGNPGATNVLRVGGKGPAALVLGGDVLKGLIPVLAAHSFGLATPGIAAVGLAAFLGHLYPLYFGFQGGKGVATALGVLLATAWPVALAALGTWLAVAGLFRISSLAAVSTVILTPLYTWNWTDQPALRTLVAIMCLLLLWRHRCNIQRLLNGRESRLSR